MKLSDLGKIMRGEKIILKDEKILEKWSIVIENAEGEGEKVLKTTENLIGQREIPKIETKRILVSPEEKMGSSYESQEREYLRVTSHQFGLRDFKMYVGARDYGKNLDCQWYLTCEPGLIKKAVSGLIGISKMNPAEFSTNALSYALDLFQQQDLTTYVTLVHHAVLKAVGEVMKKKGQDPSKIDRRSRGFLNIT
ncbi:hypothetical protein J7J95_03025 [bacterium]|nr:hypothetical protein [bacterium]